MRWVMLKNIDSVYHENLTKGHKGCNMHLLLFMYDSNKRINVTDFSCIWKNGIYFIYQWDVKISGIRKSRRMKHEDNHIITHLLG